MLFRQWLHSVVQNNMSYKNIQKNKGFTLLETLVAVFILLLVLNSAFTLMSSNLFGARYTKNQMTAEYLLQEVVDYIRNDRDTYIQHQDWNGFLNKYKLVNGSNGSVVNSYCIIDVSPLNRIANCSNAPLDPIFLTYDDSNTNGSYYTTQAGITGSKLTNFKRDVELTLVGTDEVYVTVNITWVEGSSTRTRKLKSSLMNWQ